MKKTAALMLAVILMLLLSTAAGAQAIVPELSCSLRLNYQDDNDEPISDLGVSLYRVAELSADGAYTPVERFADYGVDAQALSERADTALRLSELVQRDAVEADYAAGTNAAGQSAFEELPTGVYLIVSESISDGKTVLRSQPLLLDLPMIDDRSGVYAYDVTASPKPVRTKILRELNLVVLWRDEANPSARPSSVTVDLYCDDQLYGSQQVSAQNGWRCAWTDVDDLELTLSGAYTADDRYADATGEPRDHMISGEHTWYVVERGADGFTVTYAVRPQYNTFVVINTLNIPDEPSLPQTGQLWWPVPLLIAFGSVLILLSLLRTRRRHEK